jgi:hypothetical protein
MVVERALEQYGTTHHAKFGEIWAYEVDGFGNALMMDDAAILFGVLTGEWTRAPSFARLLLRFGLGFLIVASQ